MSTPQPVRESIDPIRTAGLSGALALHLALGLLLPLAGSESPARSAMVAPAFETVWISPPRPPAPAPPVPAPPRAPAVPPRAPAPPPPPPPPQAPPAQLVIAQTSSTSTVVSPPPAETDSALATPAQASIASREDAALAAGSLAYARIPPPPPYPGAALRAGHQGTVLLRIVVDEAGLPIEVAVARSSGHRSLDRAAVEYARRSLRFRPALRDGRPVRAVAKVPVAFNLPGSA